MSHQPKSFEEEPVYTPELIQNTKFADDPFALPQVVNQDRQDFLKEDKESDVNSPHDLQLPKHDINEKAISLEPPLHPAMTFDTSTDTPADNKVRLSTTASLSSSSDESDNESGYHRQQLEVTEFFTELLMCFGVFNNACPHDGAGCISMFALFCGNTVFSCCKVK